MAEYDNTNRGQIWKNDRKEKDTHPDYKGHGNFNGKDFWISGWAKKKDSHPLAPLVSFSYQAKDDAHNQGMAGAKQAAQPASDDIYDDDIPF